MFPLSILALIVLSQQTVASPSWRCQPGVSTDLRITVLVCTLSGTTRLVFENGSSDTVRVSIKTCIVMEGTRSMWTGPLPLLRQTLTRGEAVSQRVPFWEKGGAVKARCTIAVRNPSRVQGRPTYRVIE